jgi:hypothetical protein
LEHLDNIHYAFDELCRVARRYVIIGLPNMYEWRFRVMFLMGKRLSGKYGLPVEPPQDRHRWLFSLKEARCFVQERALKLGFKYLNYVRKSLDITTTDNFCPEPLLSLGKSYVGLA